jgi:hypothetical protein
LGSALDPGSGQGIVLDCEILVEQELRDGTLVAPDDEPCSIVATSYFLARAKGFRSGNQTTAFEKSLQSALGDANLTKQRSSFDALSCQSTASTVPVPSCCSPKDGSLA